MQDVPAQVTAGNSVLCPMLLPCVLETDPSRDTFAFPVELVKVTAAPYVQSLFVMLKVGRARPERR